MDNLKFYKNELVQNILNTPLTIPTGQNWNSRPYKKNLLDNFANVCREEIYNAIAVNAKHIHFIVCYLNGKAYFIGMNDGLPFNSVFEMLDKGLTPHTSKDGKAACHGNGLGWCSAYLSKAKQELHIISRTPKDGLQAVKNVYNNLENQITRQLAPEWLPGGSHDLNMLFGHDTVLGSIQFNQHNTFIIIKLDDEIPKLVNERNNFGAKYLTELIWSDPDITHALKISFAESPVIAEETFQNKKRQNQFFSQYNKPLPRADVFNYIFRESEFIIPTDYFLFKDPNGHEFWCKATLKIETYPNVFTHEVAQQWAGAVRSGISPTGEHVEIGRNGSNMAYKPFRNQAYLKFPACSISNKFQRLSCAVHANSDTSLFRNLDLSFQINFKEKDNQGKITANPNAIMTIEIDEIITKGNFQTKMKELQEISSKTNKTIEDLIANLPDHELQLSIVLERKSDWLHTPLLCNEIMQLATLAVNKASIPQECKDYFEKFRFQIPDGCLRIPEDVFVTTDEDVINQIEDDSVDTFKKGFCVVDAVTGKKLTKKDNYRCGENYLVSFIKDGKLRDDFELTEGTKRGVDLQKYDEKFLTHQQKDTYKETIKRYVHGGFLGANQTCPIYQMNVCSLQKLVDGNWKDCTQEEYKPNTIEFRPGRDINGYFARNRYDFNGEQIVYNVGSIVDVPKFKKPSSQNKKLKEHITTQATIEREPYVQRDANIPGEWDPISRCYALNLNHPDFAIFEKHPASEKVKEEMINLYKTINCFVKQIEQPLKNDWSDNIHNSSLNYDDNEYDFPIGIAVQGLINSLREEITNLKIDYRKSLDQ